MIKWKNIKDQAIVFFETDFTIHEVKEVKKILEELSEKSIYSIVFDMATVKYIDSSAIGSLVTVLKYTKRNNGTFKLVSIGNEVKRILKLVNLYDFFEIGDSY